jgi:2-keto-4-pentenoate hydratase
MMARMGRPFLALLFTAFGLLAAEQVSDETLRRTALQYHAKQPQTDLPAGLSYAEALQVQKRYVQILMPDLGVIAGYKAGLVTPVGQKRFGLEHPVRGILLARMLLPNDSKVPVHYGTRPILEADLVVRVKDEGINDATSIEQAARHLSEIIAFIELADTTLAADPPITAGALVASNVGARAGILGKTREFKSSADFLRALQKMEIVLKKDGQELSRVSAEGIMGHPLNAVLWLVKDLKAQGHQLKEGDILSLGSPSPQVTPVTAGRYLLIYEGLPGGDLEAAVSIE